MTRRWRPPLVLVLMGALGGSLAVTFLGLILFRYLGPEIGFRLAAAIVMAGIAAATIVLAWLFARLLMRPMQALEHYAIGVQRGQDVAPPVRFGTQELHHTGQAVLAMARSLQDGEATVRSYTQHVTHELRTPVTAIRAAVELLDDADLTSADRALLQQIDGARGQIEDQLTALTEAARARATRFEGTSTLGDVDLPAMRPDLTVVEEGRDLTLPIPVEALTIILHQLSRNAGEHGATRVTIRATPASITLCDDGPGISDGHADRIFEPFFTSKRDSGGTGMGLSIARNVALAHGCELELVRSTSGACFRLHFERL